MSPWMPGIVGVVGGLCLGIVWLVALSVLLQRRRMKVTASEEARDSKEAVSSGPYNSGKIEPIRSYLEPDEDEPYTPLPSQSTAPLSFNRYVEVRGAIQGWSDSGVDVDEQLAEVFGLRRRTFDEADAWWMMALDGAEDRIREIERRSAVFAERYSGDLG